MGKMQEVYGKPANDAIEYYIKISDIYTHA